MSSVSTTAIPGGWVERRVAVGPHTFAILAPADPDALLEELAEDAAAAPHLADPYWAKLWPAAVDLAKAIVRLPLGSPGDACLELGCGSARRRSSTPSAVTMEPCK
jgi:predicted nicotinamide N-methyase